MIRLFARKSISIDTGTNNGLISFHTIEDTDDGTITYGTDVNGYDAIIFNELNSNAMPANSDLLEIGGTYNLNFTLNFTSQFKWLKIYIYDNEVDRNLMDSSIVYDSSGTYDLTFENVQGKTIAILALASTLSFHSVSISGSLPNGDITSVNPNSFIELDIEDNVQYALSKSLKDITKPDKVSGEFSKPFKLPITEKNSTFFGGLNHNDSISSKFNIQNRIDCVLESNGVELINGFLQLKSIDEVDGSKFLNVILYGTNLSFFNDLKTKKLTDLDTTDIGFTYSPTNIFTIIGLGSVFDGYSNGLELYNDGKHIAFSFMERGENQQMVSQQYALTESVGVDGLVIDDHKGIMYDNFTPSISLPYLFNKIHEEAGYTATGDFLDDDIFKQIFVPMLRKIDISSYKTEDDYKFKMIGETINLDMDVDRHTLQISEESIIKNSPYEDFTNLEIADGARSRYVPPTPVRGTVKFNIEANLSNNLISGVEPFESKIQIIAKIFQSTQGGAGGQWVKAHVEEIDLKVTTGTTVSIECESPSLYFFADNIGTIQDKNKFAIELKVVEDLASPDLAINYGEMNVSGTFNVTVESSKMDIIHPYSIPDPVKYVGGYLTQMDLIKNIINQFNLYVNVNTDEKTVEYKFMKDIITNPFSDYTQNLMLDKKIEKNFINDILNRYINLSFADGEDLLTTNYIDTVGTSPSLKQFDTGNILESKETKVSSNNKFVFNSDVKFNNGVSSDYNSNNMKERIINIVKDNEDAEEGGKVLDGYAKSYDDTFCYAFYSTKDETLVPFGYQFYNQTNSITYNYYKRTMYKNNLGDFILSFENPSITYGTNDNIEKSFFTEYWGDYIGLIKNVNSYVYKVEMILNELEYRDLVNNMILRIGNEIFIINKITNFMAYKPTKLELFKVSIFTTRNLSINQTSSAINLGIENENVNYNVSGLNSVVVGSDGVNILGANNSITTSINSSMIGDNNKIRDSKETFITGSNNEVSNSSNIQINTFGVNVTNSSNLVITEPNTTWVNNQKISDSGNVLLNVINSGGEDSVQDDFTDAGIIDNGEDSVYDIDWQESYKLEDGGANTI